MNNSKGFTLIELLVGITILVIISVPLLRAIATSAQTNSRAKTQMKATTAAENLFEEFRTLKMDELEAKVGEYVDSANPNDASVDATGKITYTIKDESEMSADLPDGYYATVELDPNMYPNANGLNISSFESVSVRNSAIYTMEPDYDQHAYEEFKRRSETGLTPKDEAYFKEFLNRYIIIDIDKTGTATDDEGNEIDLCRVKLTIEYRLTNYSSILPTGSNNHIFKSTEAVLFDNATSKKPINGVYMFYYPRYLACTHGSDKEKIIINNTDNMPVYVYLTAMDTGVDAEKAHSYKPTIDITENQNSDPDDKAYIQLRTNLLNKNASTNLRTPYSQKDTNTYSVKAVLNYKGGAGNNLTGEAASKEVRCGDINGKNLYSDDTPDRIYKMKVRVYDESGTEVVEMDGTKLKQY